MPIDTNKIKNVRKLEGEVVSDKMNKTRVIAVYWLKKHLKYQKYYRQTSRFKAHDEGNVYKTGDKVVIKQTKPMSKDKRWEIVGLIK
ncbi:MAG: 30S ribosomal protein S17 [bacterium]|nr:30S ribosomal protein S17 [bacterium]